MIIGIGIDIIEIERIQKVMDRWGDSFLHHVFTDEEIVYAKSKKFPTQHFAARFAAKEAVVKAFGETENIGWKDIQIRNDKNGKPTCFCSKRDVKHNILISISHTKNYAVANALISSEK